MENAYIVSYDVSKDNGSDAVYSSLYDAIKSYGTWAHITESCWAVVSEQSAAEVRDRLLGVLRRTDRVMVVQSAHIAAWHNTICRNEWLKENI